LLNNTKLKKLNENNILGNKSYGIKFNEIWYYPASNWFIQVLGSGKYYLGNLKGIK
jgi:hypothetical protein